MSSDSVSEWLARLKTGDHPAAQKLWERYFDRLVTLGRGRLKTQPRGAADEEDVALSAFDSFCRGAAGGRYPRLDDRDDLWRLLVVIVQRKVSDYIEHERRLKRGGDNAAAAIDWEQICSSEPDPQFAVELAEQSEYLLQRLDDDTLRSVAVWKLENFTNEEIAGRLGCVLRTVERKLKMIRDLWCKYGGSPDELPSP